MPQPLPFDSSQDGARLKDITTGILAAISSKNFSASSPHWESVSVNFTAEVSFTTNVRKFTLPEYLQGLEASSRSYPNQNLRAVDLMASIGPEIGICHVFGNLEWHDAPKGVVRPVAAIFDFVRVKDGWLCVKYRALPGISDAEGQQSLALP